MMRRAQGLEYDAEGIDLWTCCTLTPNIRTALPQRKSSRPARGGPADHGAPHPPKLDARVSFDLTRWDASSRPIERPAA